ncbi:hypothetical protein HDU80_007690 [Chytriomyces hyalinus]|nr:hypothetical protein HDU80_007690 [Chytriomyces hyalinus]
MPFLDISKNNPEHVRIANDSELRVSDVMAPNSIRVRIDRFAVTANNITYVAMAQSFGYDKFFATATPKESMQMPVWGFATVVGTTAKSVPVSTRIYGYFPAASTCDLKIHSVDKYGFTVSRPQLSAEYGVYNRYSFTEGDPFYSADKENAIAVFRPLWATSFLLFDCIQTNALFGASGAVVISSASSKTSFCLAQLLTAAGIKAIGLTSPNNRKWVESLGVYSHVVLYDDVEASVSLKQAAPRGIVYVDIAGNVQLRRRVFAAVGPAHVKKSLGVGMSHFNPGQSAKLEPKVAQVADPADRVETEVFFAPSWSKKRVAELGPVESVRRMLVAWKALMERVDDWVSFKEFVGPVEAKRVYLEFLAGRSDPTVGYMVTLNGCMSPEKAALSKL